MLAQFIEQVEGYFERRFLIYTFFPCLLFMFVVGASGIAVVGLTDFLAFWESYPPKAQLILFLAALAATLLMAYLLRAFRMVLLRFYEGYWADIPLLKHLEKWRRLHYQNLRENYSKQIDDIYNQMSQQADDSELFSLRSQAHVLESKFLLLYPTLSPMMPTRLGNILRAAEDYAKLHYGIEAVIIWPRLSFFFPDELQSRLRVARDTLDLLLLLVTLSALFGLGGYITGVYLRELVLCLLPAFGWLVAVLAYLSALQAAQVYSELIRTAFDLHRHSLLKHLTLEIPNNLEDERRLWEEISTWYYRNHPPSFAQLKKTKPALDKQLIPSDDTSPKKQPPAQKQSKKPRPKEKE